MNSRKFKYVIAPEGCLGLLRPGERYEVLDVDEDGYINFMIGDVKCYGKLKKCFHLNGKDWIIPTTKKYTLTINGTETFESDSFDDIINKVDTYNAKDINVIIES